MNAFWHLLLTRLQELRREPEATFWVFGFPLLVTLGLGLAFRPAAPVPSRIAVMEGAGASPIAAALGRDPRMQVRLEPRAEALNDFRLGRADLAILLQPPGPELIYDPARPESEIARLLANDALQAGAGATAPMAVRVEVSTAPGSRYIDFLIPGLIGMDLLNSGLWGVGFGLVEMRQRKLLKRLAATPMRRGEFLAAQMASRLVLMLIELALLLGVGVAVFHLPVVGSWVEIILLSTLGCLAFGSLGLLVATRADKFESASGLINLVMLPMWVLSGVFFSYERFPRAVWPLIRWLPLTALNDALRAAILEGAPLHAQLGRLLVLGVWGGGCFGLGLWWFRWT